jgi:hypothetical protein
MSVALAQIETFVAFANNFVVPVHAAHPRHVRSRLKTHSIMKSLVRNGYGEYHSGSGSREERRGTEEWNGNDDSTADADNVGSALELLLLTTTTLSSPPTTTTRVQQPDVLYTPHGRRFTQTPRDRDS